MDRFICGIFCSERKVVPWHSKPVAIISFLYKRGPDTNAPLVSNSPPDSFATTNAHPIQPTQQVWNSLGTAKGITVTIPATDLVAIISRHIPTELQLTVATPGIDEAISH